MKDFPPENPQIYAVWVFILLLEEFNKRISILNSFSTPGYYRRVWWTELRGKVPFEAF